jgi:hypothetical protein
MRNSRRRADAHRRPNLRHPEHASASGKLSPTRLCRWSAEAEDRIKAAEIKYENVLKEIEACEKQTGLKVFSPYEKGNNIGAAVRFILHGGARRALGSDVDPLVTQAEKVLRTAKELKDLRDKLPEVPQKYRNRNW